MAEAAREIAREAGRTLVGVAGVVLEALPEGALWWEDHRLMVVADLHLEKGSSFARRGQLLPPYDTIETLTRLARLVARLDPAVVVALGDSFHDNGGAARLSTRDRASLADLQRGREWLWIAGNHDSEPHGLPGSHLTMLAVGPSYFATSPLPALRAAKSLGICILRRSSSGAAARSAGAASRATGTGWCSPPSGPMRAG